MKLSRTAAIVSILAYAAAGEITLRDIDALMDAGAL